MSKSESFSEARFSKIFDTLKRGKLLIAGSVAVFWAGALVLILMSPSVYESQAVYQVGHRYAEPGNIKIAESNNTIYRRLWRQFPTTFSQSGENDLAYLHEAKDSTEQVTQFIIKARARSALAAQRFLVEVLESVLDRQRQLSNRLLLQQKIDHLGQYAQSLQEQTSRSKRRIEALVANNPALAVVVMLQQKDLEQKHAAAVAELAKAKALMAELLQKKGEILQTPSLPAQRIAPDVHFHLFIATLLGLALGWIAVVASRRFAG